MERFKDVPQHELVSNNYSEGTIEKLMGKAKSEYREYLRKSAAKYIPMVLGSYLAVCAALTGWFLSFGMADFSEALPLLSQILISLGVFWLVWLGCLAVTWIQLKPKREKLLNELNWYREHLESGGEFNA